MDQTIYLNTQVLKFIKPTKSPLLSAYQWINIKRFVSQTALIFIFQYTTIMSLPIIYPQLPWYPPIGIAFVIFYLFGCTAFVGLLLAGFFAYILNGLSLISTVLYLSADIIPSFIGALLCQKILSSDINPFAKHKEWLQFIKINALFTCTLSSIFRIILWIFIQQKTIDLKIFFLNYLSLWLADLNAILLLSGFLLSWINVPLSRVKILKKPLSKWIVLSYITLMIISLVFIQQPWSIYSILILMLASLYLSRLYGYLIASALTFITATFYLAYFIKLDKIS